MKQTEVAAFGAKVEGAPAADGVRAVSRAFDFGHLVDLCRRTHDEPRRSAARALDAYLVTRNWLIHRACPEIRQTLSVESVVKLPAGNRQTPSVTSASPASGGHATAIGPTLSDQLTSPASDDRATPIGPTPSDQFASPEPTRRRPRAARRKQQWRNT